MIVMTRDPSDPRDSCATGDGWPGYAAALGALHAARDAVHQARLATRRAQAEREAELSHLSARLSEQQRALVELATRVKAPLSATDLAPSAVPPLDTPTALADLRARVDAADTALTEARRVAGLPQLLPEWDNRFARAAVVYAGFATPSLVLSVPLSLANRLSLVAFGGEVILWFAIIWPAVTAFGGGFVVARVARPRAGRGSSSTGSTGEPVTGAEEVRPLHGLPLAGRLFAPDRRYRWFGALLALACWYVPGLIIDPDHSGLWLG